MPAGGGARAGTVGALVWARLEHPRAFATARDAFVATQLVVVAGYLLAPTAPPRMLPRFGSAQPDTGWVALVQSPFAAMPSGHVAFAVVAAGIVSALAAWRWVRWIAPLYPLLVTVIVLGHGEPLLGRRGGGSGCRRVRLGTCRHGPDVAARSFKPSRAPAP